MEPDNRIFAYTTTKIVNNYSLETKTPTIVSLTMFYRSQTYKNMKNPGSHLYMQGWVPLYHEFVNEMNTK